MSASVWLALTAVGAVFASFPVAMFSRWWFLSPWVTACLAAAAALVVASGAEGGHWLVIAAGGAVAVMTGRFAVIAARARHRIAAHGGETGAGRG